MSTPSREELGQQERTWAVAKELADANGNVISKEAALCWAAITFVKRARVTHRSDASCNAFDALVAAARELDKAIADRHRVGDEVVRNSGAHLRAESLAQSLTTPPEPPPPPQDDSASVSIEAHAESSKSSTDDSATRVRQAAQRHDDGEDDGG
ncbi:MAG TPA: hypothetical protein VKY73_21115 [Polyangiaceae bacterium]|nr:hypothetical protein [Polyangiaceae bacterium]